MSYDDLWQILVSEDEGLHSEACQEREAGLRVELKNCKASEAKRSSEFVFDRWSGCITAGAVEFKGLKNGFSCLQVKDSYSLDETLLCCRHGTVRQEGAQPPATGRTQSRSCKQRSWGDGRGNMVCTKWDSERHLAMPDLPLLEPLESDIDYWCLLTVDLPCAKISWVGLLCRWRSISPWWKSNKVSWIGCRRLFRPLSWKTTLNNNKT